MNMNKMKTVIAEIIPIFLIFLYLSYPNQLFTIFDSILGRLIFVLLILFYSSMDKFLGLFVCGLVILFYQLEDVTFYDMIAEWDDFMPDFEIDENRESTMETFAKYEMIEPPPTLPPSKPTNIDEAKELFIQQHCDNGKLKYKNVPVQLQMVEHIFPEIEFHRLVCDPCHKDCKFSIVESRLQLEESLRPINTSD